MFKSYIIGINLIQDGFLGCIETDSGLTFTKEIKKA
jgi:hypothetical protein